MENFEIILSLLTIISLLAVFSDRLKVPFPILLVLVGLAISFIPQLPNIELNPEIVFIIFLPPLLYSSAWTTSWHDFKSNIRPISLAAIGLVLFTTCAVAWAVHTLVPGFDWPTSFVLGAIVSPPDAVAASSVMKNFHLHKRLMTIIEGESLVNDASGLIAYRYAISTVVTGNFILWKAGIEFLLVAGGGIAIGLALGYVFSLLHKYVTNDAITETVLTLLSPFIAYILAEHLHTSGVLSVVSTGLFLTFRSHTIFEHLTRIQAYAVWGTVIFILNGVIFILIGFQLKNVLHAIEKFSFMDLIFYGIIISVVVILVRIIWTFPAAYIPRWISKKIRETEYFSYKNVVIFSWSGMRGVVSMASALALPLTLPNGIPFPNRDLILFFTFCVVIVTLIVQGISMPWLIKLLKIEHYSVLDQEREARLRLASASIVHIEENISYGTVSDEVLAQIKSKYEIKINHIRASSNSNDELDIEQAHHIFHQFNHLQLELIQVEREMIRNMYENNKTDFEVVRKIEHELDLEEARIRADKELT